MEAQGETWAHQEERGQGPERVRLSWSLNSTVGGTRVRMGLGPDTVTMSAAAQSAFSSASAEQYNERTRTDSQSSRFGTQFGYCELCDAGTNYSCYFKTADSIFKNGNAHVFLPTSQGSCETQITERI